MQDLEQYASSYSGLMRIERLQFIADHCPQLRVEALKMALSFVQRTFNVDVYEEIHRKLTEATRQFKFMSFLQPNMVSSWKHYMYDFDKGRTKSLIIVSTQGCARCPRCGTGGGSWTPSSRHSLGRIHQEKSPAQTGEAGHRPQELQGKLHQRKHKVRPDWMSVIFYCLWCCACFFYICMCSGGVMMTLEITILTVVTSAMPWNATPEPETTALAPSMSSTCVLM